MPYKLSLKSAGFCARRLETRKLSWGKSARRAPNADNGEELRSFFEIFLPSYVNIMGSFSY